MNLSPGTTPKTFSLLSIGHRGVGKTVFLAGSYAELHSDSHQADHPQQLWFDCQDSDAQEKIEGILSYVARTGQYPPLTIKITNFNFSLKYHSLWDTQTLCYFRWCDIPGEFCNIHNLIFQAMVSTSEGCCVFIDAHALVHKPAYRQALENIIIDQVMPIANLVYLNHLRYAFALILTKCDLLESGSLSRQQLNERLQPLFTRLDAVRANYQTFYSSIPIVHTESASTLKPKGAALPLLWLVWELSKAHNKAHNSGLMNNLLELATPLLPRRFHPPEVMVKRALHTLTKPAEKALSVKKILGLHLQPANCKYILFMALITVSLLGVISTFLVKDVVVNYVQDRGSKTTNLNDLRLLEQRVQEQPEHLELRLQLAKLYERTNQLAKAETAYDQVLAQQKSNLNALIGKANLRHSQGDNQAARTLFAQAEKAAPPNLKANVRALAQKTLQLSAKPIPPTE